jgi:hypothetical protein
MVIFHSYVSLPEGTPILGNSQMVSGHGWMNGVTFFFSLDEELECFWPCEWLIAIR